MAVFTPRGKRSDDAALEIAYSKEDRWLLAILFGSKAVSQPPHSKTASVGPARPEDSRQTLNGNAFKILIPFSPFSVAFGRKMLEKRILEIVAQFAAFFIGKGQ